MKRRNFLQITSLTGLSTGLSMQKILAAGHGQNNKKEERVLSDRHYWISVLNQIASPILSDMSRGELQKRMLVEYSPAWDGRNKKVAYMEAFGRLIAGMAPFVALQPADNEENKVVQKLKIQIQQSLKHAVDPYSPDYLYWGSPETKQPLVDAAYIAQALMQAPEALWNPLDGETKQRYIDEFTRMRIIEPVNNNWVLFAAMIETFLLSVGEKFDPERIDSGIDKINSWYVGDGWYSDGAHFHFDHYNAYVMHPMLIDILRVNLQKGRRTKNEYDLAYKRMQRYATLLERYISPEGTYPVFGRSSTYRMAAFQPLAKLAFENSIPDDIHPAQVRCALTAVMKRMFVPSTFTKEGYLTMGLVGDKQSSLADYYSNTGSMYITSLVFLPLGLPADHEFWSAPFTEWTQKKAWSGEQFLKDYAVDY